MKIVEQISCILQVNLINEKEDKFGLCGMYETAHSCFTNLKPEVKTTYLYHYVASRIYI